MLNYRRDRVLKEIPVFVVNNKDSPFYVFEYPTRPSHCTFDNSIILEARFKRENKAAEIDLSLKPTSSNYDSQKGRELFHNNSEVNFESGVMDKITFRSQPRNAQTSHYAMGVLKDGALFLTGLAGWLQLTPTFHHFDKGKTVEEDAVACEKARAVTVKFAAGVASQATNNESNSRRSWLQHCQIRDREPWTRCRWIGADQCRTEAAQQHLFGAHDEHLDQDASCETAANSAAVTYLTQLVPVAAEIEESNLSGTPTNTVSLSQLRTMPLCDQIRAIFVNAKVLRFQRLLEVLRHVGVGAAGGFELSSVLRYCGECAVLVRGIWVVRSEALFPPGTFSTYNGVPAELLCRGRDYILWKFTQGRHITRKEISSVIKLPSAEVTEILQQISRQRQIGGPGSRQRWEFLHELDNDFIRKHADVWQRSESFWAARVQQLCSELRIDKLRAQTQASRSDRRHSTGSAGRRSRSGSRSTSASESSDLEFNSELLTMAASKRNSPAICGRRRSNSTRRSSGSESPLFASTLESHATGGSFLKDLYAPQSTSALQPTSADNGSSSMGADRNIDFSFPSAEVEADMRTFVLEKLRSRLVVSQSDLARFYQVNATRLGLRLNADHLHHLFQFTVVSVGGIKLDNEWPAHGLPKEPLFAWAAVGDGHDPLRGVLLAQFRSSSGLSFQAFRRAAELAGIVVEDGVLRRLLKNYCIFQSKSYHLKGTLPTHGALHS